MELLERIQSLLCRQGIVSDLKEDSLSTGIFTGAIGSRLRLSENSGLLHCMVVIPIFTPEYRRPAMAQALSKANFALPAGCFQMDGSDGELRFRSSMPVCDGNPTDEQLRNLMLGAWHTTARYTTALVEVAFTDVDPEIAIARAEASWQEAEQQALLQ